MERLLGTRGLLTAWALLGTPLTAARVSFPRGCSCRAFTYSRQGMRGPTWLTKIIAQPSNILISRGNGITMNAYKQRNLGSYASFLWQSIGCVGTRCALQHVLLREQFGSYGLSSHSLNIMAIVPWVTCFLSCPFPKVQVTPAVHYFVLANVLNARAAI